MDIDNMPRVLNCIRLTLANESQILVKNALKNLHVIEITYTNHKDMLMII